MAEKDWAFAQRRPGWHLPDLKLDELQLDSFEPLEQAARRQACPQCGKSRSLFCYDCLVPFTSIPNLQLPFQLHIITHAAERSTKATGAHAAVLCKGQVHLQSLDQLPQLDPQRSVVMFPSDDAVLPDQLPVDQLDHVIIIDSKWRKARELNGHPALQGMKRVKLPGNPRSTFWRYHTEGVTDEGVCTIEALHLLMRALADRLPEGLGQWDNLLWYYAYQHKLIEQASADRAGKRQLQEAKGGYVKQKKRRQQEEQQQQQQQQQQQAAQQQEQQQHEQVDGSHSEQTQEQSGAPNGCADPPKAVRQGEQQEQAARASAPREPDGGQQQQQQPRQVSQAAVEGDHPADGGQQQQQQQQQQQKPDSS